MPAGEPIAVEHVDLAAAAASPQLPPRADGRDRHVIFWWGDVPLGAGDFNHRGMPARAFADAIGRIISEPVARRLLGLGAREAGAEAGDSVPDLAALLALEQPLERLAAAVDDAPAPPPVAVTLAICTRDRPEQLARCLASIQAAAPRPDHVLVVDNGPSEATRAVTDRFPGVRYIAEPRPGLSVARNTAVAAASGDVIAFVDDDTEVAPTWLHRLCAVFADPGVVAATGLVLPGALDTPSQVRFEKVLGGFSRGFQAISYGPEFFAGTKGRAVPVWQLGAGANMAIRLDALRRVGAFDERLGAGASGCSEDSELWYRLLADGGTCRYEPSSVVFHHHRGDDAAFERQAHEYVRGHVSALFVQFARYGHLGNLRRALLHLPRYLLRQALAVTTWRTLAALRLAPADLRRPAFTELAGYARGLRFASVIFNRPVDRAWKAPLRDFLAQNPFQRPLTEGFFYREKMRAIHRIAPQAALEVLEVGGGQSGMARMLYPGARVTVLDAEPVYAESDVNRQGGVTFVHGDATRLPFADASFDVVTFFDVLEHIEDDRAAVAEAWRVVRPGGHILVSTPNERWRSPYHRVMDPICPGDAEMIQRWGHVRRGYSVADLTRLFAAPPAVRADFINRITVIGHDIAFSHLPGKVRLALLIALSPVIWAGYLLQPRGARGTEIAARWRRPKADEPIART